MRRFLVSSFLAEMTQQIHSFRASGVMAAQRSLAAASDLMALRKSAGSLWGAPLVIALVVIRQLIGVSWRPTSTLIGMRGKAAKYLGRALARPVRRAVWCDPFNHAATQSREACGEPSGNLNCRMP
jgi:hypothetical protein